MIPIDHILISSENWGRKRPSSAQRDVNLKFGSSVKLQSICDVNFFLEILEISHDIRNQRIKLHQKSCGEQNYETKVAKGVTLV